MLKLFTTFNGAVSCLVEGVQGKMLTEWFDSNDESSEKTMKQYFELILIVFALIKVVLDKNPSLKDRYEDEYGELIGSIMEQKTKEKHLANVIELKYEGFYPCLFERIRDYSKELSKVLEKAGSNVPELVFYYYYLDPGNILTIYEPHDYNLIINDFLENDIDKYKDADPEFLEMYIKIAYKMIKAKL